jgi:nitrogen fixation/metabolism regulation signal transduction histidine kinase
MMNNSTSLPRKNKDLQSRLVLTFSALFMFCVLALSIFLFNVLQLVSLNNQAQMLYEQNQHVYKLESMFKQYHLDIKNYAISSSPLAEQRLTALQRRIDEILQNQPSVSTDFKAITRQNADIQTLAAQIIEAVDDQDALEYDQQDWSEVAALSLTINNRFADLHADLELIRVEAQEELDNLTFQAEVFSLLVLGIGLLSIPAFLALALIVAMTIYAQINLPLEQLTQAAQDLKERKFKPADIEGLTHRQDEIGAIARDFLQMASAVEKRAEILKQEAEEIRAKIR